jgi:hypothetical protein
MKHILSVVLLASLFVIPCLTNADISLKDDDLLLYLPLNGDTEDMSKNGNHGELMGSADFVEGKYGEALEFSEAGEVSCPYIPLNEKSFTVCLWINPTLSGASEQCVFTQTQNNATNTSLHYRIYTSGTVRMGFYSNDLDAAGAVKAGEWAHLCFWLDVEEESRRIYLNGNQLVEDAGKAGILYLGASGNTMIGSWGNTGQKFSGIIDEVQVWDRALTEREIQQSMEDLTKGFAVDASGKLANTWASIKNH